jgi:hypothetical protein
MEQAIQMEETGQIYSAKMSQQDMAFIVNAAGEFQDKLHWATIRNEVRNRSGRPVMIARRPGAALDQDEPEVVFGRDQDKAIDSPEALIEEEARSDSDSEEGRAEQQAALEEIYDSADEDKPEDQGEVGTDSATPPNNSRALNP